MSFITFVDWVTIEVGTPGAAALLPFTELGQLVLPGSDPDLYQVLPVSEKHSTVSNSRNYRVIIAAMVRGDEHRRKSPLQRMINFLVKDSIIFCSLGPLISQFLTDKTSVR